MLLDSKEITLLTSFTSPYYLDAVSAEPACSSCLNMKFKSLKIRGDWKCLANICSGKICHHQNEGVAVYCLWLNSSLGDWQLMRMLLLNVTPALRCPTLGTSRTAWIWLVETLLLFPGSGTAHPLGSTQHSSSVFRSGLQMWKCTVF